MEYERSNLSRGGETIAELSQISGFSDKLDKHFPKNKKRKDKLENITNRHTVNSGTPNMKNIISNHNKKILKERRTDETQTQMCNCQRGIDACPFNGEC